MNENYQQNSPKPFNLLDSPKPFSLEVQADPQKRTILELKITEANKFMYDFGVFLLILINI